MALQKSINKRVGYDQAGNAIGSTAALATGISGERCDTAPIVEHSFTLTAASKYGYIADGGLVVNPKEGVRYGGSFADGLDVAAGANVAIATKGHYFLTLLLSSKQAIAKGATVEATTATGGELTLSATSGTAGAGKTIYGKVLEPIAYTAADAFTEFSTSATYNVGDIVKYEGAYYKCKTAIAVAGAWDASKWDSYALVPEKGAEQFKPVDVGGTTKYAITVKIELV